MPKDERWGGQIVILEISSRAVKTDARVKIKLISNRQHQLRRKTERVRISRHLKVNRVSEHLFLRLDFFYLGTLSPNCSLKITVNFHCGCVQSGSTISTPTVYKTQWSSVCFLLAFLSRICFKYSRSETVGIFFLNKSKLFAFPQNIAYSKFHLRGPSLKGVWHVIAWRTNNACFGHVSSVSTGFSNFARFGH